MKPVFSLVYSSSINMFLLFFLLFSGHLSKALSSKPQCSPSFECKNFGSFTYTYPLYTSSMRPECGFFKLNCTKKSQELQLQDGKILVIKNITSSRSLLVSYKTFNKRLKLQNCDVVDRFAFQRISEQPRISSDQVKITMFKCSNRSSLFDHYHKIECNKYFLYYSETTDVPMIDSPPNSCVVLQLPYNQTKHNFTDLFSLLSTEFHISFRNQSCSSCPEIQGTPSKGHTVILALGVGVVALIVGVATISIVKILSLKRKFGWRLKAKYNVNAELFLQNHEFLARKRYSYSQVQKMTSSFKVKLGQGGFGSVYKGVLNNENVVAVKVLNESKGNGEDFINEVASVGRTYHVNIVTLVGFCLEGRRRALIYEFMPNGSLEKFIYGQASPNNTQLGWEKLHQIAIGIARGLEYLHRGCNTRILHFDIKPHNILLDQDFCPKIADFGLAKLFPEKKSMISVTDMRGTPGYIAPELFSRNFGVVSHKSDVYSYGMMILEMVGGRKNIEVKVDHTSEIYFPHWIYKKVELDEDHLGLQEIVSDEEKVIAKKMIIVGLWCIQTNPLNRPTITKALEMLEGDLELLEVPPKPYMSYPTRSVGSPSTYPSHPGYSSTNTL